MQSRREFLQTTSLLSLSPVLPSIFGATAMAAEAAPDERVLVVIQLDGGNDGINTVVPFGDDGYGRNRTKLRLETERLHKLGDHVGLHSSMRAAKQLYDDGRLAIVQGVGYPNPDRSHFRSMKIWQTASFDKAEHDSYGWIGRSLDERILRSGATRVADANAVFIGQQETPVALWGRRSQATAFSRERDLRLSSAFSLQPSEHAPAREQNALQQFVTRQVASAYGAADAFQRQAVKYSAADAARYPDTELSARLQLASQLLKSGSRARVIYTIQSGYDTHSTQLFAHAQLLREFSDAIQAFLDDMQSAGLDDRVLVLAFSEFGRRVQENDSQGTDHGTAGPVFLAGRQVTPGLVGKTPELSDLDEGDLKMHVDFRSVYATLLDKWLRVDAKKVLGGTFAPLPIVVS